VKSWNLEFVNRYWRFFNLKSLLAYRRILIDERRGGVAYGEEIILGMTWPIRQNVVLRPSSNDHYTFKEVFEEEVYSALCRNCSNVKTIVDLGANIGLASLYLLNNNPEARLFAVEPDPSNFKLLMQNLDASRFRDRSHAIQAAVWSDSGPLEIHQPESAGHVNQYRVKPCEDKGQMSGPVSGMTIQQIMEVSGFDTIDILKVDIEGAEIELLKGNVDWIKRVRWMAIEFHEDSRSLSNFDAIIAQYGWKILDESMHTVVAGRV
jgi:FkbM family methyltransferase